MERARLAIMNAYSEFWTKPEEVPQWAKDSGHDITVLRSFPSVALKACADALYGDVYDCQIENLIHDEYAISLTRRK